MNNEIINAENILPIRNRRFIGVFVISLSMISVATFLQYKLSFSDLVYKIIWCICIVGFIFSSYFLMTDFKQPGRYFRVIYTIFILYQCFIIIKGIINNIELSLSLKNVWIFLGNYPVSWAFIVPLFIFFTKDIRIYFKILNWIIIMGILFLFLCIIFPDILTNRISAGYLGSLSFGCVYILILAKYFDKRRVNMAFIVALVGLVSLTYLARRSGMFSFIMFFLVAYIINFFSKPKHFILNLLPLLIFAIVVIYFNSPTYSSKFTARLERRLTEDTRSEVFEMFFLGMKDDMIFGKGMYGTYYCPISGEDEEEGVEWAEIDFREIIENGYLQLILSGGIVYLVLFVLILLPAALLGIFKSRNQFTRSCGIIILLWLIDMFLFGLPTLSLHYIFVWICVGICYNSNLRFLSENKIDVLLSS